jgi:uncharacterized membrane protein YtjA (UPF0391 family)
VQRSFAKEILMSHYALPFLIIAIVAGALSFGGVAGAAVVVAKILFLIFLILFVFSLLIERRRAFYSMEGPRAIRSKGVVGRTESQLQSAQAPILITRH